MLRGRVRASVRSRVCLRKVWRAAANSQSLRQKARLGTECWRGVLERRAHVYIAERCLHAEKHVCMGMYMYMLSQLHRMRPKPCMLKGISAHTPQARFSMPESRDLPPYQPVPPLLLSRQRHGRRPLRSPHESRVRGNAS